MSTDSQSVFAFAAPKSPRPLTQFQQRVLEIVRRASKLPQGLCLATKTIAAKLGCSISYVQKALKELRERGFVDRQWDFGLKTRRRFRVASAPGQGEFSAVQNRLETHREPPIGSVDSADSSPSIPPSPPISSGESSKEDNGKAPSPVINEPKNEEPLIAKAVETLGVPRPAAEKIVADAARKAPGRDYVAAALEITRKASGRVDSLVGYFFGTLRGLAATGQLPASATPKPKPAPQPIYFAPGREYLSEYCK